MKNTKTKRVPSTFLDDNIKILEELFADCQDYIGRKFPPGGEGAPWIYTAYIDAMTDRELTLLGLTDPFWPELFETRFMDTGRFVVDARHTERTLGVAASPLDEVLAEML